MHIKHIKTTRYDYTSIRIAKIWNIDNTKAGKDMEK